MQKFKRRAIAAALFAGFCCGVAFCQERANDLKFSHKMPAETNQLPTDVARDELAQYFKNPAGKVRTGAYWYWLSGNSSVEGVQKDVAAMKSVGIDRAYIGDIGVDDVATGPTRFFSDRWWEIVHAAFKAASEHDVEMGIFNSPGWSQSGGPWVSYKQAMRYLVSSETRVSGPAKFEAALPRPEFANEKKEEYQDAYVLAYPVPKDYDAKLVKEPEGGFNLSANKPLAIEFDAPADFTARSVKIEFKSAPIAGKAEIFARVDGKLTKIGEAPISRYNPALNVGFLPYAPVFGTFPATTSREFRVVVTSDRNGAGLTRVELCGAPQMAAIYEKTLAKMHETPQPPWTEYQWAPQAEIDDPATALDPAKIVNLTANLKGDVLTWDVPEGDWIVLRAGMTPTGTTNAPAVPEATGYEVDKISREHTLEHFNAYMQDLIDRFPAEDMKSFKIVIQDSYEVGGQNITDDFSARFEKAFGYDPTPFIPVYFGAVVKDRATSDRFLWDLRRFIADEISYSYVGGLRDASNANGKKTWLECYGH
ncbi:MAG: glycoside hydrolase family 2, partial [Thermoguttaceae bacterium]|nr:glycoside hydrolase family 2 [Thermoguttaceae bacterium]